MSGDAPKFILDRDLFPLCKALRILGIDALCRGDFSPSEAMRRAVEEHRIWIKDDMETVSSDYGIRFFVVQANEMEDQLSELENHYRLSEFANPFARCLKCNELIVEVSKPSIEDLVPQRVYATFDNFYKCESCGRIYWPGTHQHRMKDRLSNWNWSNE